VGKYLIVGSKEIAKRAYFWISNLSTTAAKQQSVYLGSSKYGYNIFGYGCTLFGIEFYPTDEYSNDFFPLVGLYNAKGSFANTLKVGHKEYASLEDLTRTLSFRRIATIMKRYDNIRKIFLPSVADDIIRIMNNK